MAIRNPFDIDDFGDLYAPRQRRNYFSGVPEDPIERNQKEFIQKAGYSNSPSRNAGPPQPSSNPWDSWMAEMRDAYTKTGPAYESYQEHIGNLPQYQTPSKWQKFGAALVGGAEGLRSGAAKGWAAGQEAAMAPYKRELGEWAMKEKALGQQLEAENRQSQRRIEFMNQVRQVAKDEQQARQWMADYDFKVWAEKNNVAQDEATRANWDRMRNETYRHNVATEGATAAQQAETGRHNRATEGTAAFSAQTGRMNAITNQQQLDLARQTEDRIRNAPMLPSQTNAALHGSLERAELENPAWDKFYDSVNQAIDPPDDRSSPEYQEYLNFMTRANDLETKIRGAGNPMPAVPEPGVRIIRPPR